MNNERSKYHRTLDIILLVSIVLFMIVNIIRILQWFGETELQLFGMSASGTIVIVLIIYHLRNKKRNFHQSLGLLIVLQIISIQQHKFFTFPAPEGSVPLLLISVTVWTVLFLFTLIRNNSRSNNSGLLMELGIGLIICEIAFKYFGLPFTFIPFFLGGTFSTAALFLRSRK